MIHILFHGNCYDGFGAAYAAWRAFQDRDDILYKPAFYGSPPPDYFHAEDEVYLLDFSYPRDVLTDLRHKVKSLTVIDHHQTAEKDCVGLDFAHFDMHKSGAMLAWEHFHKAAPAPTLLSYIQDRDLWRFELPNSREVNMALRSYPLDFEIWDVLMTKNIGELANDGTTVMRFTTMHVDMMARQALAFVFSLTGGIASVWCDGTLKNTKFCTLESNGTKRYVVPAANATCFFSEVGERLNQLFPEAPFSAYYYDRGDRVRQWGLRSVGDFDVSEVAKAFKGGGHKNSAGFTQPL